MSYCSNCGAELNRDVNFCSECGEQVGASEPASQTETTATETSEGTGTTSVDRISINTGAGSDRFYTINSITYFQNLDFQYSLLAKAMFAVLALLVVVVVYWTDSLMYLSGGAFYLAVLWYVLRPDNGLAIGTLAERDQISTDVPDVVEREFLEKTSEQISIEGVVRSRFSRLEYVYHFLRDKVISVERFKSINRFRLLSIVFTASVILLFTFVLARWMPSDGVILLSILLTVLATLILVVGVVYTMVEIAKIRSVFTAWKKYLAGLYILSNGVLIGFVTSFIAWEELNSSYSTMSSTQAELASIPIQVGSGILLILAGLLCVIILRVPHSGVLISLPSGEKVQFSMSDEDVETVVEEFR